MARLSNALLLSNRDIPSHYTFSHEGSSRNHREGGDYNKPFFSKIEKLEFPKFSRTDPIEWINIVNQ